MPWITVWVAMCIEMLTAAGVVLMRNPRVYQVTQSFLTRYAQYCVEQSRYLWRWAELKFGDQLLVVNKNDFVKRVMDVAEADIMDFLRLNNVPAYQSSVLLQELRDRVLETFLRQIASGVPPANAPLQPPAWPWLW